jgi:hypothetical protein
MDQQAQEQPPCGLCHLPIQENQAKAELYCFHRVHTTCLQGEVDTDPDDAFVCLVCVAINHQRVREDQEGMGIHEHITEPVEGPAHPVHGEPQLLPVLPQDIPPTLRPMLRTRDRIRLCLQEHPEFRKDLLAYIKTRSEITKAHRELVSAIRLKKEPVRAEVLLLKNQIDEHIRQLKTQVHQGQEFKTLRSKSARLYMLERKIEGEFGEDFHDIRRALRDRRGLKRLQSSWRLWYHRPARVMRRAFYLRLRF